MKRLLRDLLTDRQGAVAMEYGFILALIVIALMIGLFSMAEANGDIWSNLSSKVSSAR